MTRGGVTPQGGDGALGTVMAMRVTPDETLGSIQVVNGADGKRHSEPCACGVYASVRLSFREHGKAVS
jgi:hypothetical protein